MTLKIGIVGSRRRNSHTDRKIVFKIVHALKKLDPTIVSGACPKGADAFAAEAARSYGLELVEFPVPKGDYRSRGEFAAAAFARNKLVAEHSDIGFALVADDRTGGTENTVGHYKKMKKNVYIVDGSGALYLDGEKVELDEIAKSYEVRST